MKNICVFCGSGFGDKPVFAEKAAELAAWIAGHGYTLVYGGGKNGLMGILADSAMERGGKVIGIITNYLKEIEVEHPRVSDMRVLPTMEERKKEMIRLSDAFIVLPGGYGTFEEMSEVLSWNQLKIQQKKCVLFNIDGYYDRLIEFYGDCQRRGFVHSMSSVLLYSVKNVVELEEALKEE